MVSYPIILSINGEDVVVKGNDKLIKLGEQWNKWQLMDIIKIDNDKVAVFENFLDDGMILFVNNEGVLLELPKTLEKTEWDETGYYLGHKKEEVFSTMEDILGNELLAHQDEPSEKNIKDIFPPIQVMKYWKFGDEAPHTYIGSKGNADVIPLYYDGTNGSGRVNVLYVTNEVRESIEKGKIKEGLVGGWIPVVRMVYPVTDNEFWEALIFAKTRYDSPLIQPAWYRYAKIVNDKVVEIHYFDSYLPYPVKEEPESESFYRDLFIAYKDWNNWLPKGMRIDVPDVNISNFCLHSFALEMITRNGDHPRYGLINKNYGAAEHDGFMDILTSSVECYMEWGMFDTAKRYFENYFTYFIKPNGNVMYRGPSIGRYAKILADLAQYFQYTADDTLIVQFNNKIRAIINILMDLLTEGRKLPLSSIKYGLIKGRNEADMNYISNNENIFDQEPAYFSINATTWRGFRDLGKVLIEIGEKRDFDNYCELGNRLLEEADTLNCNLKKALYGSILYDRGTPFLPTIAGSDKYYYDYPYRSCPDSFDDNREWCEIMQAGNIPKDIIEIILEDARKHQGMKLGIFSNRENIVAFISYGEAYGLIQHDMIKEFLIFYYTHLYHLNTRGTWTGFECVDMDRMRGESCSYCIPAQLTIPTVTKWMLVFEDPIEEILWLAKATPQEWLESGKAICIYESPTRWGKISYEIISKIEEGIVIASIHMSKIFECKLLLRLRLPEGKKIKTSYINDRENNILHVDSNTLELPNGFEDLKITILCD